MTAAERKELASLKAEVAELRKRNDELVDGFLKAMQAQPVIQWVPCPVYPQPIQIQPWPYQPSYPWITYCGSGTTTGVEGTVTFNGGTIEAGGV
jgi:hypothetical protein